MTDSIAEVERIAAGLTKAQRERICRWPTTGWFAALPSSERREFRRIVERETSCTNRFTSLGLAVRAHLMGLEA